MNVKTIALLSDEWLVLKSRVRLSLCCRDVSVTLNYGLVTEAPLFTLNELDSKAQWNDETIRTVVSEIAECILCWHCHARMANGNIVSGLWVS